MKGESKPCVVCGRKMEWRKKWAKNWDEVKYCSDRCRGEKHDLASGWEEKIMERLRTLPRGSSADGDDFLPINGGDAETREKIRQAARRLANEGRIEILQNNKVLEPSEFRGKIRLRVI